jgi:tetratricopeptide (TPR) repeat protein
MYLEPLRNYEEAANVIARISTECKSEPGLALQATLQLADLAIRKGDSPTALRLYQDLLKNQAGKLDGDRINQLKVRAATTLIKAKKYDDAAAIYVDMAAASGTEAQQLSLSLLAANCFTNAKHYDAALSICRKIILEHPSRLDQCLEAQKNIFLVFQSAGDGARAVSAAARYFYAANTPQSMEDAIKCVAQSLRTLDKNLARSNAFLKFQKFGIAGEDGKLGTPDDLQNPLSNLDGVSIGPIDADESKALEEALAKYSNSTADCRLKGYLNLLYGRPPQAVSEFKRALMNSPVDAPSIQTAVNDVGVGLKALNGQAFASDAFVEFFLYGPKGKDGKSNLSDPLKDF